MEEIETNYFDALYKTAKAINSSLSTDEVLSTIVRVTAVETKHKGCSLMLLDDEKKHLVHMATYGLSDQFLGKGLIRADQILTDIKNNRVIVHDVSSDARIQYPKETINEGIASELTVPLNLRGTIIGALRIYSAEKQEFSGDMANLLSVIAELSAIAIENAKMHDSLKKAHRVCQEELGYWLP